MAWGRKKSGGRKEPRFGLAAALADLRLDPKDRIPAAGDKPKKAAKRRTDEGDDEPAPPPPPRERKVKEKSSKRRSSSRGHLSLLVYWGAVLGLWGAIAIVGVVVWVGA